MRFYGIPGKLQPTEVKASAEALKLHYYQLFKITGTRCVRRHITALKMLDMSPTKTLLQAEISRKSKGN